MYLFTCVYQYICVWFFVCMNVIVCRWSPDGNPEYDYSETAGLILTQSLIDSGREHCVGWVASKPGVFLSPPLQHCNCKLIPLQMFFFLNMDYEDFTLVLRIAEQRLQKELSSQISFSYLSMKRTLLFNDWREERNINYICN